MSETLLEGRSAIVTGGGRGIGKAICEMLINAGASVIIADNGGAVDGSDETPALAAAVAQEYGDRALPFSKNIAAPDAASEVVKLALDAFGGIDIVVNCAAILRDGLVFKSSPEDWDIVVKNNLSAAYYLINAVTPLMRDQFKNSRGHGDNYNWGRIINIGSTAGLYGNFGQANYGSAKAGLFGLTRITAMEMVRSKVTANYIAPFAHSRVSDMIQPANQEQAEYKDRAIRVSPNHVGNLVTYLCSDYANDITGQVFGVRGREVFIFNQPRPIATITSTDTSWSTDELAKAVDLNIRNHFTDLSTDLEAFNTDPIV